MAHDLEKKLNAPAKDILDAISRGMRAQVDVKGKLAELYLYKILKKLETRGKIRELEWMDKDGAPDFKFICKSRKICIECKNLRNEVFRKPEMIYKVEIQKTRNSKDGSNTRSYRKDHFDILAVCKFNQTGKWEFVFIKASNLEVVDDNPKLLKIMHRVPVKTRQPWTDDLAKIL